MFRQRLLAFVVFASLIVLILQAPHPVPAAPEQAIQPLDNAPFGINSHLASRYPDLHTMNLPADLIQLSGAGWAREDLHWYRVQPDPYTWDWSFIDAAVQELVLRDIEIVGVIGHPPGWATPYTGDRADQISFYAPDPQQFAAFSKALVQRYGNYIKYWEIWNEPDHPAFWLPQPDAAAYARMLKLTSQAIRSVDPEAKILIGGINPYDTAFLQTVIDEGAWESFDILAVHPYVDPASPEYGNLIASSDAVKALASKYGTKPLWVTEVGWASGNGDRDESNTANAESQASYLVRSLLLLWQSGAERIFWYTLKDDPHNPYGLIAYGDSYKDYSILKPAFHAFRTLNQTVANAEFVAMHDPFQRNVILDFETFDSWKRTQQPNGSFRPAQTIQHSGQGAAQLSYRFSNTTNDYVVFERETPLPIQGEPYSLGMWVYGDGSGNALRVWLRDAKGEVLQFPIGTVGPAGWRFVQTPLARVVEPGNRISKDGDGILDFPASLVAIVLDDTPDSFRGKGTIYLDDLIAITGPEAYDLELRRGDTTIDVLWASQPLMATLQSNGPSARLVTRDGNRRVIQSKDGKLNLPLGPAPIYVIQQR